MTLTLAFLTLFGAMLGLRGTVRALALASIASAALLTAGSIEAGPLAVAGRVAGGLLVLQAGYFAGMLLQAMGHVGRPVPLAGAAAPRPNGSRIDGVRSV